MSSHSSGFGNGIVVGMVLGAVFVLLFTTKKGRQILHLLSEEGFDKVKDWEKILDELDLDDSEEMDDDYLVRHSPKQHTNGNSTFAHHRVKPTYRRIFRGVPRQ